MTPSTTPAERVERTGKERVARETAVIAVIALGGVVAVGVWLSLLYVWDSSHERASSGTHLAPWPFWLQFVLIPLVALLGGRLAPNRVRAVVIAACAGQVGLVVVSRMTFLFEHTWFALQILAGELVLVALTVAAARLGSRLVHRGAGHDV